MKYDQLAEMKCKNGNSMFLNAAYITGYAYIREKNETFVAMLGEPKPIYFPGDQTEEIRTAFYCIESELRCFYRGNYIKRSPRYGL